MIFEKVKATILDHTELNESSITMETSIMADLGVDSLDMLDILMDLEDAFNVDIPEKKIGLVIGDIVHFIEAHCPNLAQEDAAQEPEHVEVKKSA